MIRHVPRVRVSAPTMFCDATDTGPAAQQTQEYVAAATERKIVKIFYQIEIEIK